MFSIRQVACGQTTRAVTPSPVACPPGQRAPLTWIMVAPNSRSTWALAMIRGPLAPTFHGIYTPYPLLFGLCRPSATYTTTYSCLELGFHVPFLALKRFKAIVAAGLGKYRSPMHVKSLTCRPVRLRIKRPPAVCNRLNSSQVLLPVCPPWGLGPADA